jgi:amino acid transporter
MKLKNIFLPALLICTLSTYAEGQAGLGTFIAAVFVIGICLYTLVGGILATIFLKVTNLRFKNDIKWSFFIAFILSVLATWIFDVRFLMFWEF